MLKKMSKEDAAGRSAACDKILEAVETFKKANTRRMANGGEVDAPDKRNARPMDAGNANEQRPSAPSKGSVANTSPVAGANDKLAANQFDTAADTGQPTRLFAEGGAASMGRDPEEGQHKTYPLPHFDEGGQANALGADGSIDPRSVGRGLANGLQAFGGVKPTDFAAKDAAKAKATAAGNPMPNPQAMAPQPGSPAAPQLPQVPGAPQMPQMMADGGEMRRRGPETGTSYPLPHFAEGGEVRAQSESYPAEGTKEDFERIKAHGDPTVERPEDNEGHEGLDAILDKMSGFKRKAPGGVKKGSESGPLEEDDDNDDGDAASDKDDVEKSLKKKMGWA